MDLGEIVLELEQPDLGRSGRECDDTNRLRRPRAALTSVSPAVLPTRQNDRQVRVLPGALAFLLQLREIADAARRT